MLYQLSYSRLQSFQYVGVVGFEPTQLKATDLQSAPALQLRRTPAPKLLLHVKRIEPAEGLEPPTS